VKKERLRNITYLFVAFLMVQMDLLKVCILSILSIMLCKNFIYLYINISYKQKQIFSHIITEIHTDHVNLTVLEDAYSVYISHKSQ
jgi:hypothetical protein